MTETYAPSATVDQLLTILSTIPTSREAKGEGWETEWEYELGDGTNTRPYALSLTVEVAEPVAALDHDMNLHLMFGIANEGWTLENCTEHEGRHYMNFSRNQP